MAGLQIYGSSTLAEVESSGSIRTVTAPRGQQYCVGDITGTIGAALGANSSVFAMRLDPSSPLRAFIDSIEVKYTTIVAYTTPVTAGRRLAVFRGSGAAASGGTAIAAATPKSTVFAASEFDAASGGDIRIATTGALTVTGITYETAPICVMPLVHVGSAGNYVEHEFHFDKQDGAAIQLEPGQVLAIRNPAAMDAAGTWQLSVEVHWREAAALTLA